MRNNNQNIRIGVDVDNVIARFIPSYVKALNNLQGTNIVLGANDPKEFHFETGLGFDKSIVEDFWRDEAQNWEFWWNLERYDDAAYPLRQAQADLVFVSNRPLHLRQMTAKWIRANFSLEGVCALHSDRKGYVAYGLELHGFIDDKPENLVDIKRQCGLACKAVLLDRPWNRSFSDPYIYRVHSLQEGLDLISGKVVN